MCSIPANALLSLKSPSHLFSQIHCTVISSPPSIAAAPPFCAACRWHRGMQIGTECKESDLNTHFCSTVCHERLSYPIRSTTLLVAFTLLAYHHPCSYRLLISIISPFLSSSLVPPIFLFFSHIYFNLLYRLYFSFVSFLFPPSSFPPSLYSPLLPCPALALSCQSTDYSIVSQAVCIYNTVPFLHMDSRRGSGDRKDEGRLGEKEKTGQVKGDKKMPDPSPSFLLKT